MKPVNPWSPDDHSHEDDEYEDTEKLPISRTSFYARKREQTAIVAPGVVETRGITAASTPEPDPTNKRTTSNEQSSAKLVLPETPPPFPNKAPGSMSLPSSDQGRQTIGTSRKKALLLIMLLGIILVNAITTGMPQFIGPQGWAYVLAGSTNKDNANLLQEIGKQLRQTPASGVKTEPGTNITPQQYIDAIIHRMTLDMKLGQMMIVQFVGPDYSLDLNNMISQFNVGAVLIFAANQNIVSRPQLKGLIQQMQSNSTVPLTIAIDQEGGYVNRLANLNGPRPSEAVIGATDDPQKAKAAGIQDAQDLSSYGINLNLAPVIDVDNNYKSELHVDQRTYGNNPTLVIKMASAYLQGLQQSGKVLGTLKHFPGLGGVAVDPHIGVPRLTRTLSELEQIDWAPYRALIQQGNVHAIMVTHEILTAVDSVQPSTLSPKIISGILRNELGFQNVIMTDSLTMKGITDYVPEDQAAALAVEAGSDLLMGASTPRDVAAMIEGIKQAVNAGTISQQRIDESVRRILLMKYKMGLLSIPAN